MLPFEVKSYFDKVILIQDIVTKEIIVSLTEIKKVFTFNTKSNQGKLTKIHCSVYCLSTVINDHYIVHYTLKFSYYTLEIYFATITNNCRLNFKYFGCPSISYGRNGQINKRYGIQKGILLSCSICMYTQEQSLTVSSCSY